MVEVGRGDQLIEATQSTQGLGELMFLPLLLTSGPEVLKRAAPAVGSKDAGRAPSFRRGVDQFKSAASPP